MDELGEGRKTRPGRQMKRITAADGTALEAQALIETDDAILEQIRKDLSEEYVRFMSRMLREQLAKLGKTSIFDSPRN